MENSGANNIVEQARGFLGTPFVHQGRAPGVGLDCIGMLIEINKRRGNHYDRTNYGRLPFNGELEAALDRLFVRTHYPPREGDILLFEWPTGRQHVGIFTDVGVIHAYESGRRKGRGGRVVEHALGPTWSRLIKAVFSWPVLQ